MPREVPTARGAGLGQLLGVRRGSLHVSTSVAGSVCRRVRRRIRIFYGLRGWRKGTGRAMVKGGMSGLDGGRGRVRWRWILDGRCIMTTETTGLRGCEVVITAEGVVVVVVVLRKALGEEVVVVRHPRR